MPEQTLHIHLVSDSTGETVHQVARACLAQFADVKTIEHVYHRVIARNIDIHHGSPMMMIRLPNHTHGIGEELLMIAQHRIIAFDGQSRTKMYLATLIHKIVHTRCVSHLIFLYLIVPKKTVRLLVMFVMLQKDRTKLVVMVSAKSKIAW